MLLLLWVSFPLLIQLLLLPLLLLLLWCVCGYPFGWLRFDELDTIHNTHFFLSPRNVHQTTTSAHQRTFYFYHQYSSSVTSLADQTNGRTDGWMGGGWDNTRAGVVSSSEIKFFKKAHKFCLSALLTDRRRRRSRLVLSCDSGWYTMWKDKQ